MGEGFAARSGAPILTCARTFNDHGWVPFGGGVGAFVAEPNELYEFRISFLQNTLELRDGICEI
ncbi:hypothetical protein L484_001584 [Morus notabilis]|uniref:Uncharacterized protein n=1 Tax=Morus notabilis TaxID=981085 RepID=W9QC36_9ROSA|nr:hypothetical protein L484_001584 [Morus notabilis]